MGLDMYLRKYEKDEVVLNCDTSDENCYKCNGCKEEAIYWRKANQIHNWFVKNIQNGVDDCGYYEVSIEKLKELKELCGKVLEDNSLAEKLLPSTIGFFFGSTEYDEYYFEDLERTVLELDILLNSDKGNSKYLYNSSW